MYQPKWAVGVSLVSVHTFSPSYKEILCFQSPSLGIHWSENLEEDLKIADQSRVDFLVFKRLYYNNIRAAKTAKALSKYIKSTFWMAFKKDKSINQIF